MYSIGSRWRKQVSNKAKRKAAAISKCQETVAKMPSTNISCSMPQPATSTDELMDFLPENEPVSIASTRSSCTLMDDAM
ncbi:hypothetical protein JTE90_021435 [Oedothorax gibbosus]|uniref:Uncharacterized protein n=1 Tax=Oedothorax gibbosus TaxID=931172 RepID=A0AAV6VZ64_9ARAC|nr:hypothetical protein JTE90_021435 [Oedothorax gibbosus]